MTNIEAPESDYLYTQASQIPEAGKGLYTAIDIYKGEIIAYYKGRILTEQEAEKRILSHKDQYFINMLDGRILDSYHSKCFAKYANDGAGQAGSSFRNNAKISLDEKEDICLIAARNIRPGEEIFCAYGRKYWEKHRV